jgi:hypothetical protein
MRNDLIWQKIYISEGEKDMVIWFELVKPNWWQWLFGLRSYLKASVEMELK